MANQVIGKIPEFTQDDGSVSVAAETTREEEVKEISGEEPEEMEKTTPSEPPAEEKISEEKPQENMGQEAPHLERAIVGLRNEREKLLKEIVELKGKRRTIKQEELALVEEKIDELKDVNPEDVTLINRVLRAKGFVTKEEASKMFYDSVKNDTLSKFLEKYPEYKPDNDSQDIHWGALQRELQYYRMPDDPHKIMDVLERAHKSLTFEDKPKPQGQDTRARKRSIEIASHGSSGKSRSSSSKSLDPEKRMMLQQGGFTDEDIKSIEKSL